MPLFRAAVVAFILLLPVFAVHAQAFPVKLFKKTAKVEITHVPHKGATQALTDAVAGGVSVHFSGMLIALPHVQSGRLRALGLTSTKRLPSLPDMNTVAEAGLPGYEVDTWQGFYPAGIPAPID